jgi:hypothetical protein
MKRRLLFVAAMALAPLAAQAGPRDDVIGTLVKCTDVTGEKARLACYDQEAPALRAAAEAPPPPPPAPVATSAPPPAYAPPPQQDGSILSSLNPFSSDTPAPSAMQMTYQPIGQEILPITIKIADYSVASNGNFTVTLANGQVWQERPGHTETPRFSKEGDNVVTIEHGMLGGYNLYLAGNGQPYKVMRIK